jgi:DNA-binding CsgD family transcriptional regulator/N-acetylneuraminic acid mutarotase
MSIPEESLSERELDVLNFLARGASNREIAEQLVISPNTVKVHVRNIFAKLAVSSRTEATTVALQQGLVTLPGLETPASPDSETTGPALTLPGLETPTSPDSETTGPAPTFKADSATGKGRFQGSGLRLVAAVLVLLLLLALASLAGSRRLNTSNEGAGAAQVTAASPEFVEQVLGERWLVSQSMPAAHSRMAMAAVGLHLYQIGGETADGVTDTVHIYDTGTFQWRTGAPKLTAVADVSAAVLFGEIYVAGGRTASGQPTDVVEVYSPANNAWRRVVALPRPIAGALTLSDGSFLYLFGGWDGNQYLPEAYLYDPGSDGWRPLPPMSRGRAFAAGGALANRLYVVGGFDGQVEVADCEYYEPPLDSWTECAPMLLPRGGAGAAVLFNRLFVLGGGLSGDVASGEWFDAGTQTWQVVNMPMMAGEQPLRWTHLGVAPVERHIYLVGGQRGAQKVADTFVFVPYPYQSFIPAASGGGSEP